MTREYTIKALAFHEAEIDAVMANNTPAGGDRRMAVDMFLNNVKDAGLPADQYEYPGTPDFDYRALQPYLKELEDNKEAYYATV